MFNTKNKYFKPFIYCSLITITLGMIAFGIMWVVGPVSWTFVPTDPEFPKLANLIGLLATIGFFGTIVFGILWIIAAFKSMPQKPV